ncbi:MAG: leucyl/phenylalanyl-tRNA--protein transferase, partial [Alphaproteobacteria bacterium]
MSGLTPQLLLGAYASGIFPMAENRNDPDLYWIDPDKRGILPLDQIHIPRRLRRTLRASPYEVCCNTDFISVVSECAAPSQLRPETWINTEIESLYGALHDMGFAHSVECWQSEDGGRRLVGGLYG